MWKDSKYVGCAAAKCGRDLFDGKYASTFYIVCNYYPPWVYICMFKQYQHIICNVISHFLSQLVQSFKYTIFWFYYFEFNHLSGLVIYLLNIIASFCTVERVLSLHLSSIYHYRGNFIGQRPYWDLRKEQLHG